MQLESYLKRTRAVLGTYFFVVLYISNVLEEFNNYWSILGAYLERTWDVLGTYFNRATAFAEKTPSLSAAIILGT